MSQQHQQQQQQSFRPGHIVRGRSQGQGTTTRGRGGGAGGPTPSSNHQNNASVRGGGGGERGGRGRGTGGRGRGGSGRGGRFDGNNDEGIDYTAITPQIQAIQSSEKESSSFHPLVDIGANLAHKRFQHDWADVTDAAVAVGVSKIVITGTSIQASQRALQLTTKYGTPGVLWSTAGVHPHDAKSCNDKTTIPTLRKIAKEPTCVAIGECGLDFDRNFSDPDVQEYWFEEQLKLAVELKMPLFLHERAAHASFVRILSKYRSQLKAPVCVHCFTGTKEELQSYIGLDCHIGITGWVCDPRRGQALRDALHLIPLDRLMIETDAPFLTPKVNQTLRHVSRNEPVLLPFVLDSIASLLKIPTAQLAHITTANALTFFGLDGDNNKTNNNGNVAATTET